MDIIRVGRRDLREFLAFIFIDFVLFIVRLIDKFYGVNENQKSEKFQDHEKKEKKVKDVGATRVTRPILTKSYLKNKSDLEQPKLQILDQERSKTTSVIGIDRTVEKSIDFGIKQEATRSVVLGQTGQKMMRFSDRNTSCDSDVLDELSSSISPSISDHRRQISALSDYYSSEEDISKEWNAAMQEEAIADSLALAESLESGSVDPEKAGSAYDTISRGLEELRQVSQKISENWNQHKNESSTNLNFSPNRLHQRKWIRGSADSVLDCSSQKPLTLSGTIVTGDVDEVKRQQKLNQRMNQECEKSRKLQLQLEKKKIKLHSKVTDQKWKDLSDRCEVLYLEQGRLRDECKTLSDNMTSRKKEISAVTDDLKSTLLEIQNCFREESEKMKVWNNQKLPECLQIEDHAKKRRIVFESKKSEFSDDNFEILIAGMNTFQEQHFFLYSNYFEEWLKQSQNIQYIFEREYLDVVEHEKRNSRWKDFSAVDELQSKLDDHLNSYEKYVSQIFTIHEQRSSWSTGIFGLQANDSEFEKFNRRYEKKTKAVEEDHTSLETLRKECCQGIKKYSVLYEMMIEFKGRQHQYDAKVNAEKIRMIQMNERLAEHKRYIANLFISKLFAKKKQNNFDLGRIEHELKKHLQITANHKERMGEFEETVCEFLNTRVLQDHLDKCNSFFADWERKKQYDKIYAVIHQIENFDLVERPDKLEFDTHEERVITLERRLPIMVQIHEENYSTCMKLWLAQSRDYEPSVQEPISYDELEQTYYGCKADYEEIKTKLVNLEKTFRAVVCPKLSAADGCLLKLGSQGFEIQESEFNESHKDTLENSFHQLKRALMELEARLIAFDEVFDTYSEHQSELFELGKSLFDEECNWVKLQGKLEECEFLLSVHRDRLERRRITEKVDRLSMDLRSNLLVLAKNSQLQYEKLQSEQESLKSKYVDVSGRHLSELSDLKSLIPQKDLEEIRKNLFGYEQKLSDAEDRISKCYQEELSNEENTIHEYWSLVQNLAKFMKDTESILGKSIVVLNDVDKRLPEHKIFVQEYRIGVKCYTDHLSASKEICGLFSAKFSSTTQEFDKLSTMMSNYESLYIIDESGSEFKETTDQDVATISSRCEFCRQVLLHIEDGNADIESSISSTLTDDRPQLDRIEILNEVISDDLCKLRSMQETCQSCLSSLEMSRARRTEESDRIKKRLQEQNYDKHCSVDERNPIENNESFTCSLCSTEIDPRQGITLRECLHQFCKNCLRKYVKNVTTAVAQCPLNCESSPCCGTILDKEILSLGDEVYEEHTSRSMSEYASRIDDLVLCWNVKCRRIIAFYEFNSSCSKGEFICPHCKMRNCKQCKVVHEDRETCESYQLSLPFRKIAESTKCPVCHDRDICIAFQKCGHTSCRECYNSLKDSQRSFQCPFCRKPILSCLPIYLPFGK